MSTLVVMAAGLGSRYGGLKQIDPIGANGAILPEYTAYDACQAGFDKVIFILREEILGDFKALFGDRIALTMNVAYVIQQLNHLPNGFTVPEGRTKPWGTGHAVYCARHLINEPFLVVNADDFYGRDAFIQIARFLKGLSGEKPYRCAMAGYQVENTLTDYGTVSRGVCQTDQNGFLTEINELTKISLTDKGIVDGATGTRIPHGTHVSMNTWGFPKEILNDLENAFVTFLENNKDPLKGEFYLPFYVDGLLKKGEASVRVLPTETQWYGITYREDKDVLTKVIKEMTDKGIYPETLFK